jgi:putative nucleotidyltransferase with HDIG domain
MTGETAMKKIRIKLNDLKHGMRIADDIYALNGTLIALKNSIVDDRVMSLLGRYHVESVNIQRDSISENRAGHVATRQFKESFHKIHTDMKKTFEEVISEEQDINVDKVTQELEVLIKEAGSGFDLLNMLLDMGEESDSTYQHSIQVSMLSRVLGSWLKFPEEDVALLGVAGLFHDIGKCQIDAELLNKEGQLSESEYTIIRQHAILGYKIVKDKNIDVRIKQAVLSHHERCDGSGYPLGIRADGIGQFARVVAIADVYAGMTAKRPYRERSFSPFEVVNYMEQEGFGKFDSEYLICFLSRILNSYIHRKVRLNNGLEGEIIFINKANLSKPLLKIPSGYLDLSLNPELSIIQML